MCYRFSALSSHPKWPPVAINKITGGGRCRAHTEPIIYHCDFLTVRMNINQKCTFDTPLNREFKGIFFCALSSIHPFYVDIPDMGDYFGARYSARRNTFSDHLLVLPCGANGGFGYSIRSTHKGHTLSSQQPVQQIHFVSQDHHFLSLGSQRISGTGLALGRHV